MGGGGAVMWVKILVVLAIVAVVVLVVLDAAVEVVNRAIRGGEWRE